MLRSRAITPGFRLFGGISVLSLLGAFLFALGNNIANSDQGLIDSVVGPLSLGWKGGAGSHLGYTVLVSTAVASGGMQASVVTSPGPTSSCSAARTAFRISSWVSVSTG